MSKQDFEDAAKVGVEEFWVKLHDYCKEQFDIPRSVHNYYRLGPKYGLICELKELKNKTENKKVNQDIFIDVDGMSSYDDLTGKISAADMDFYEIRKYGYLLLKIKEVIAQ